MSAHYARALLLFQQARHELAEEEFRLALAEDPNNAMGHAMLGLCLARRERYDEAGREAAEAVQREPDEPFVHYAAASIFNDRGSFQARAVVGETVKAGVVVAQGIWWTKYTPDGANCNATASTQLTDFGAGATFFDNLVEVEAIIPMRGSEGNSARKGEGR